MRYRLPPRLKHVAPSPTVEIAIAHDYLTQRGGAERVVLALHRAFPDAPIYTTLYNPATTYPEFADAKVITSPLNKIGFFRRNHRAALPLLPFFSQTLRVSAKKTIVSSAGWAHGYNFAGSSVVYCHSPARWLYLSDQYLGDESNKLVQIALRALRPALIWWDHRSRGRAGQYLANSSEIKSRIKAVYDIDVPVVFPPYSINPEAEKEAIEGLEEFTTEQNYFLIVSRLLPYKNVQAAVEAFAETDERLLVIGSGPEKQHLQDIATDNVRFVSNLSDAQMRFAYANAKALLAVSYEDFGLTPLEAGAFGRPTIALKAGGYLDTIKEGLNGSFIVQPTPVKILEAVTLFRAESYDAEKIIEHVKNYSEEKFIEKIRSCLL